MSNLTEKADALRAKVEKMTPGKWAVDPGGFSGCADWTPTYSITGPPSDFFYLQHLPDAEGIAALKNSAMGIIDDLLAALAEAELVAWALCHGFELINDTDTGYIWGWYDKSRRKGGFHNSEWFEWNGIGIPPLPDEVREAILKQKEQNQ